MENSETSCSEIENLDKTVFKPCRLELSNIEAELESQEYSAHTFKLDNKNIIFRTAKITPTKTGQFVTIWKRNAEGITAPFDISDDFDFFIIAARKETDFGVFIFAKNVLHQNGILSVQNKDGKRGIRVYPPWDLTNNKTAQKTQNWQTQYFLNLSPNQKIDLDSARNLLLLSP